MVLWYWGRPSEAVVQRQSPPPREFFALGSDHGESLLWQSSISGGGVVTSRAIWVDKQLNRRNDICRFRFVFHRWIYLGRRMAEVKLSIGGPR